MDRGAWQASVLGVTKSQTQLSNQCFHFFFSLASTDRKDLLNLRRKGNSFYFLMGGSGKDHKSM